MECVGFRERAILLRDLPNAEEKLLVERYREYTEYANRTKRIIPFLS